MSAFEQVLETVESENRLDKGRLERLAMVARCLGGDGEG
jgi:hypothetical protein